MGRLSPAHAVFSFCWRRSDLQMWSVDGMWRRLSRRWPTRGWYSVVEFGRGAHLSPWTLCEVPCGTPGLLSVPGDCCKERTRATRSVQPVQRGSQTLQHNARSMLWCRCMLGIKPVVLGTKQTTPTCWRLDGAGESSLDLLRQFHELTVWRITTHIRVVTHR